jgi:hypothetical protein
MFLKQSMQEKSPGILRSVSKPSSSSEKLLFASQEQPAKPQIAVFITHGMGQQVPFETIDSATEGLVQAAARKNRPVSSIRARTIQIDGIKTQRTEFDMRDVKGRDVEVHVYEGFWAPITEGHVTLRDVMSFLYSAGFKGLWNCRLPFERWVFGGVTSFGNQIGAASRLLLILAVLLSLVVLNAITAIVSGYKFTHLNNNPYFSDSIFAAMTTVVGIYLLICMMFGSAFFTLMKCKGKIKHPKKNLMWRIANKGTQFLMWVWVACTIISAILLLLLTVKCLQPENFSSECISKLWLPIWVFLLLVSWKIRKLLVQFMGDVAAYIDSHSLDRFSDIRTRIKARVFEQTKAVYSSKQYEHIAMVGHSLGSVITYDTLNALINYDELNGNPLDSVNRTKLLLTFGSPLDKTAFIFSSQKGETTATREALAATLQPLIQAYYPYRNINWINIYAPHDIISGKLDFYDDKKAPGYNDKRKVHNIIDEDAMIPLAAHVEYWNNTTLFDQLYANL